jgi:2-methylcitrate dehydratase
VYQRVELFHRDSVACAVSAIACGTNAPNVLRAEAFDYPHSAGVACFGSRRLVHPEKAIAANCAAVREWDANGTNFGYNPERGDTRGEFGHNDFYPVVVAAAQLAGWDGARTLKAMICLDEIRGRLAEVFALRNHQIDHVLHGAIASATVYGAALGATVGQIESAIGMLVSHYVPFRAIRGGHQLSDSKGASAALSAEMAALCVHRALRGFVGPSDIFRNPQAVFCLFEPPEQPDQSPFDLTLATRGDDFAVMGMHFKLGLYEHQSAGAIQGLLDVLQRHPEVLQNPTLLHRVRITTYQPALRIIADPAKRDPRTRQSADHSLPYIIATLLRKAFQTKRSGWQSLMLLPDDYSDVNLHHPLTRQLIDQIEFVHGGPEYDARYPDGIPTRVELEWADRPPLDSGLVMYPAGHARSELDPLPILDHKFRELAALGVDDVDALRDRFTGLAEYAPHEIRALYDFGLQAGQIPK